jgi:hypothetical protein
VALWCAARGGEAACVCGNTCGLWIFFHVTLANLDRISAAPALRAIGAWVGAFFGCAPIVRATLWTVLLGARRRAHGRPHRVGAL